MIERATGDVEFRNVTFTYPGRDVPALRNINLKIPAGKTVALVGRSGSGKSTIASLITRFYDIDEGEILMDGHDLREYTLASLRNQVALVSQNVHLFNDTVANNIAYARTEQYSREQIEEAARMAYAMDFINKSAMRGTQLAHTDGNVPNLVIRIPCCSLAVSVSVLLSLEPCCVIARF